jgi:membrane associated rhomboid family serine protease
MVNVNRMILFPILWPLGTTAPAERPAWASWSLLGINLAMLAALFVQPGWVTEYFMLPVDGRAYHYLTYAFAHANLLSGLLSVMLIWTYGPALENRIGPWLLLLLYGAAAVTGAVAHHFLPAGGGEPLAGASAAICGLIGATLVLFPRAMVRFYAGILFIVTPIFARVLLIHAAAFAALYAIAELLLVQLDHTAELPFVLGHSVFSLSAHLGGLAAGAALAAAFLARSSAAAPVALPRRIRDQAEARKPSAVIHEPLGPYKKFTPAQSSTATAAAATIAQVDPEPDEWGAATPPPDPNEASFEKLFRQRLLFADDEDDELAATPELDALPAISKTFPLHAPAPEDDDVISFDQTDPGRRAAAGDFPGRGQAEESHPPLVIPALESDPGLANAAPAERPGRPAPTPPIPTPEGAAAPASFQLQLETSEETQAQARELRDTTAWPDLKSERFAVILAPGRPMNLTPIVETMARSMGLTPRKAYGKLMRRRGILADNLGSDEAEYVASQFAQAGHPVLMAALTSRIEFGEGLDLVEVEDQGEQVRFVTVAQSIPAAWKQVVFLAAGEVSLRAGLPGRTVLDIFLVKPHHHLRLWESPLSKAGGTFRETVELVTQKATRAIHTSSLDKWFKGGKYTLHRFGSQLEYDHYLRWHLLAHLATTKQFKPR